MAPAGTGLRVPPTPAVPSPALLDRVLASLDGVLPFVPKLLRLPVAAVAATVGLLVVLWLLVALLRH